MSAAPARAAGRGRNGAAANRRAARRPPLWVILIILALSYRRGCRAACFIYNARLRLVQGRAQRTSASVSRPLTRKLIEAGLQSHSAPRVL